MRVGELRGEADRPPVGADCGVVVALQLQGAAEIVVRAREVGFASDSLLEVAGRFRQPMASQMDQSDIVMRGGIFRGRPDRLPQNGGGRISRGCRARRPAAVFVLASAAA